jgi:hypothetical protein
MRCAISQPTFIPWLGWFDIFDQSDQMVLLDTVQFEKQSWQQRNRIRTSDGLLMISVPVLTRGRSLQGVRDVEIANPLFATKFLRTIAANYAKAPFFGPVFEQLSDVVPPLVAKGRLADLNEGLIALLAEWLDVTTPVIRASELEVSGSRGEYVASLCEHIGATHYLSTAGAAEYLEQDVQHFVQRGISVWLHRYEHPTYDQLHEPFISHASALDLVMMHGGGSAEIMRGARGGWEHLPGDPENDRSVGDEREMT